MDNTTTTAPDTGAAPQPLADDVINDRVTPPLSDGEPIVGSRPAPDKSDEAEAKKPDADNAEEAKANAEDSNADEAADEGEKPKPSKAERRKEQIQQQINDLTAQKRALERETQAELRRLHELQASINSQQNIDPEDYEAQESARLGRALDERAFRDAQAKAKELNSQKDAVRYAMFESKLKAAEERIPDLSQAVEKFAQLPVSEYAADIIAESDKAPELTYFLANNPHEAKRIASLPPHMQGVEIARIEGRINAAPKARKTTQAPTPPPQVTAANSPTGKSYSEMSMEEYAAARKAEMTGR